MFCNNCGNRGHVFRDCNDPILSCGVILVRDKRKVGAATLPIPKEDLEVLMVRRRDSMSYTEFLRGKYDPEDETYLKRLFENMTIRERERIETQTFDELWTRLWGNQDRKGNDYRMSKELFEKLDIPKLMRDTLSIHVEPEWGFPKGRRIRCETDSICAEREFFEETNITKDKYVILQNIAFQEQFIGTNGIPYQHKYIVGIVQNPIDIRKRFTPLQAREVSAIAWKSMDDCVTQTRAHLTGRKIMIDSLVDLLQSIEFENRRR